MNMCHSLHTGKVEFKHTCKFNNGSTKIVPTDYAERSRDNVDPLRHVPNKMPVAQGGGAKA